MFNWLFRRAYLFAYILFCDAFATLYEGDKCSSNDAIEGICRHIKECPTAVQLIETGVNPIICGFKGIEPVVCCNDGVGVTNSSSSTTTTTEAISRKPGEISKQKCKEYAEYAYEKIYSPTLLLNPQFKKKLVCDIPRNKLTVGSTFALRREFPHMAIIGFKQGDEVAWQCGGSLISENFVLTAAHCLFSRALGPAKVVRLGFTNFSDLAHMQERAVSETIIYPEFTHTKYHDIGLLRLSKEVGFDTYVHPACLQTKKHIPYDLAISIGWGNTEYAGASTDHLLEVILEFIDGPNCNNTFGRLIPNGRQLKDGIVDDLMICVGTTRAVRATCTGDSGGPLQVYHTETEEIKCMYDVVGITSFGVSACGLAKNSPTVHTRVSHYIKWIEDIVWPN